ncbi:alkene reductase [Pantoea ananatis]|uniref:alkene reductase n=1 Tax=Pantoea ananas TaxID=553 RepID=UPI0024AD224D|nr:alkene reductase [Pantoea ananatis]MDI6539868.1 alkene reductase [Pantoea ananatis]
MSIQNNDLLKQAISTSVLMQPLQLGAVTIPNRIIMAPMTRGRGTRDHLPTAVMAEYYAQRASAGLIITEAVGISQQGLGWAYATGIWSGEQVRKWRIITEAVHNGGGRIIMQLWHMGRTVHSSFNYGLMPVSASATSAPGLAHTYSGKQPYEIAKPLTVHEISGILDDFRIAARNAVNAGFDGVQIHAANGYLIDQFLRDSSNFRTDIYGGSINNRIRLLREVTETVAEEIGADRTGVRLSPNGETQGVVDSDPLPLFQEAIHQLSAIGIAHLELREPPMDGTFGVGDSDPFAPQLRPLFKGPVILNADYDVSRAEHNIKNGTGDAVAFGRHYIANPDLVTRIARGISLASSDPDTWFTQSENGYTDYPTAK